MYIFWPTHLVQIQNNSYSFYLSTLMSGAKSNELTQLNNSKCYYMWLLMFLLWKWNLFRSNYSFLGSLCMCLFPSFSRQSSWLFRALCYPYLPPSSFYLPQHLIICTLLIIDLSKEHYPKKELNLFAKKSLHLIPCKY